MTIPYYEKSEFQKIQDLAFDLEFGAIDVITYLERIPDKYLANKQELIDSVKNKLKNR